MRDKDMKNLVKQNHAYIFSALDKQKPVLLFGAGGTAGHINPALAVADQIAEMNPDVQLLFCGNLEGPEYDLVRRRGYLFYRVNAGPFELDSLSFMLRAVKCFFQGRREAKQLMKSFNVKGVLGTGGYVMAPVIAAARRLKIKTFIHEQNAYPGKSTRSFAKNTDCVFISYPGTESYFTKAKKVILTGNPVAASFFEDTRNEAREKLGLSPKRRYVVVTGGSQGARTINSAIVDLAAELRRNPSGTPYFIHLITGKAYYSEVSALCRDSQDILRVSEYAYDMQDQFAAADLIVCRAGAGTCAELAAMGKPSILVPYPYAAGDHQNKNAQVFVDQGAAFVIPDQEISGLSLRNKFDELFLHPEKLEYMGSQAKQLAKPDAAREIAAEILRETGLAR